MLYRIREWVEQSIPKDTLIFKFLQILNRYFFKNKTNQEKTVQDILDLFAQSYQNVFLIQIGANDGVTGDPLHDYIIKYKWKALLIEPIEYIYKRLVANYHGVNSISTAKLAISDRNGLQEMWFLKETADDVPVTYDQLGSFRFDVLMKHKRHIADIEKYIIKTQVPCMTFENLIETYAIDTIELLQMDTEGYDYTLLNLFDFDQYRPIMVMFENAHMKLIEYVRIYKMLKSYRYTMRSRKSDTIALRSDFAEIARYKNII